MWLIQSPNPSGKGSVYFSRISDEVAIFTDQSAMARSFETATIAKQFIKDNELTQCHPIPK